MVLSRQWGVSDPCHDPDRAEIKTALRMLVKTHL